MQDFKRTLNQKKGVAGLEIPQAIMISVLSLVLVAFMIVLVSSKMIDSQGYEVSSTRLATNQATSDIVNISRSTSPTFVTTARNPTCLNFTSLMNDSNGRKIDSTNYTVSNCAVTCDSPCNPRFNNYKWEANYSYTYDVQSKGGQMFNETINEVADNTTDNVGLIIFLGFLVVIVVLVSIALFYLSRVGGSGGGQGDSMIGGNEGA